MITQAKPHRVQTKILANVAVGDNLRVLELEAPTVAAAAQPGHFVHLHCHPSLTLPRPFSIMNANLESGSLTIYYQVVGRGTAYMAQWQKGDVTWLLGPIGQTFSSVCSADHAILVAGGVGLAPLKFLAEHLNNQGVNVVLLWGMESSAVPFPTCPARWPVPGDPIAAPMALAWAEENHIVSRLASTTSRLGFFHGFVTDLADKILAAAADTSKKTFLYVCGPMPMMAATAKLAKRFGISGEASLEAHMACGFGGCAGCVTPIQEKAESWQYQRVCVKGPVFALTDVVW